MNLWCSPEICLESSQNIYSQWKDFLFFNFILQLVWEFVFNFSWWQFLKFTSLHLGARYLADVIFHEASFTHAKIPFFRPHYLVWKRHMEGALSECLSLRLNGNVQSKESWNSWWDDCIRQDIFTQPFTISSLNSRKNTLFLLWESPWNSLFLKKKKKNHILK